LVKTAFETAKVSNGKEQDFVNELRTGGNYIPGLALVAEENGQLVGHIMLTHTYIVNCQDRIPTLLLAPISVALEYRNMGIGSRLILESSCLAKDLGHNSVFLVGDPAYYQRLGFKASIHFGISNTYGIPEEYVMGCELVPGALSGINGNITW
jgi:putative acetyltransferase